LINKQEGFLALQSYFVKATLLLDRENINFHSSFGGGGMADQVPML
jgi:hypothetical protein